MFGHSLKQRMSKILVAFWNLHHFLWKSLSVSNWPWTKITWFHHPLKQVINWKNHLATWHASLMSLPLYPPKKMFFHLKTPAFRVWDNEAKPPSSTKPPMRIGGKVDHGEYGMENSESWMESFYLNILSFCYSVDMEHAQATNNRRGS